MKKTFYNLIKVSGLITPSFVLGATPAPPITNINLTPQGLVDQAIKYLGWFEILIGLLAVIVFFYAGYLFMTAGGDATKVTNAKTVLWWGIIGVIVMMAAFVSQTLIRNFLGV